MPKKFWNSIKIRYKIYFFLIGVLIPIHNAFPLKKIPNGIPYNKKSIRLSDGRSLKIHRILDIHNPPSVKISLQDQKNKTIWTRTYIEEFDTGWEDATFIPITKGKYLDDINRDSLPEIAIEVWTGGNSSCTTAHIFSINKKSLDYLFSKEIYTELVDYALEKVRCRDE